MRIAVFSALLVSLLASTSNAALFVGDTFGLSINVSPADQSSFEDINGVISHTFANGTFSLGASNFDPTVEVFIRMDENEVSATNSIVTIEIFGQDAGGNLANPLGDGSVAGSGAPFTIAWFDLGAFNGGSDTLDPAIAPYTINSAFVGMLNTADEAGGTFSPTFITDSPDGISTSVGFNIGSDIATADLNSLSATAWPTSGEFVGWTAQFDVTAVPEPTSALPLLLCGMAFLRRRA